MHELLTTFTIILSVAGYIPYINDTLKGKTKPHIYSWLVWSILNITTFGLQFSLGGGLISIVPLIVGIICSAIMIFGLKNGTRNITKLDGTFLALATLAIFLWIIIDQPLWSSILVSTIGVLGLLPTLRKSLKNPFEETLSTYVLSVVRYLLTLSLLQTSSLIAVLPPLSGTISISIFCSILIYKRLQMK